MTTAMNPAIKARIMKAARHLPANRMAWAMKMDGVDWRGCNKGHMAEVVTEELHGYTYRSRGYDNAVMASRVPSEEQIEATCRRFRLAANAHGETAPAACDRECLLTLVARLRAEIVKGDATLAAIKAAGKPHNFKVEYETDDKRRELARHVGSLRKLGVEV